MKREIFIEDELVQWFKKHVHPHKENHTFNGEELPVGTLQVLKEQGLIKHIGSYWDFKLTEVGVQVYYDW